MKVIFHEKYHEHYARDPAAAPGRMESVVRVLRGEFSFLEPSAATESDLERVHGREHIRSIMRDPLLFEVASLAAGGAILAAQIAYQGEPAFGLVRPPGHHASPHSCWGFCYFNNVAVAIKKLLAEGKIRRAFILDFDLHYGDGTANIFAGSKDVSYFHPNGGTREAYLQDLRDGLEDAHGSDIIAVSAGFDRHEQDWGGLLSTEDYRSIGEWVKEVSKKYCDGRRFAVLEGGYNHSVLGANVRSFIQGLAD